MCWVTFAFPNCGCPPYPVSPHLMLCPKARSYERRKPHEKHEKLKPVIIPGKACQPRGRTMKYTGMPCAMCRQNEWESRRAERKYLGRRRWLRGGDGSWERGIALSGFTRPSYW